MLSIGWECVEADSEAQVRIQRTPVRKIVLRLQWKPEYPQKPPLMELRSSTISEQVLGKLESAANKFATEKCPNTPSLVPIIEFFYQAIDANKLLFAKAELDQINELLKESDEMKLNYKRGTVLISQKVRNYYAKFRVTVPDEYPVEPVSFKFLSSNFHPHLTIIFATRVQFLIGRILKGYRYALPSKKAQKKEEEPQEQEEWTPSSSELHEIRQDLQFLKKIQDLKVHSDDKNMRRAQTRLLKAEATNMSEKEKKQLEIEEQFEQQQIEMQRALDRRTLFPVVGFIMKELIQRLPKLICYECQLPLLPETPPASWKEDTSTVEMEKDIRVERLSCDHWYHYNCLEKIMSRPPFDDKKCLAPDCEESIHHNVFNIKFIRKMEQRWLKKEERRRELADIADFLT